MHCLICGAPFDTPDNFCRSCGRRLGNAVAHMPKPSPIGGGGAVSEQIRDRRFVARMKAASVSIVLLSLLMLLLAQAAPSLFNGTGFRLVDLGVTWSETDYNSIMQKCAVLADAPPEGIDKSRYSDEYIGSKDISWSFTESEMSAFFSFGSHPGYWPVSNVQIKLHPGNIIESSCNVDPAKLLTYPAVTRYLPQEIKNYVSNIPLKIPLYAKAKLSFTSPKQVEIKLESLSALGFTISDPAMSTQANQILQSIVNDILSEAGPVSITGFSTGEGNLEISGTWFKELKRIALE